MQLGASYCAFWLLYSTRPFNMNYNTGIQVYEPIKLTSKANLLGFCERGVWSCEKAKLSSSLPSLSIGSFASLAIFCANKFPALHTCVIHLQLKRSTASSRDHSVVQRQVINQIKIMDDDRCVCSNWWLFVLLRPLIVNWVRKIPYDYAGGRLITT